MATLLALALFGAGFVAAEAAAGESPTTVTAATPAEFDAQAKRIRDEIKPGGRYGGINGSERETVERNLDTISSLLHKKGSASALSSEDKTTLFNAQEQANAILADNEKNRLICTDEIKSGTHFKQKICQTAAERELVRRKSQDGFRDALMIGGGRQAPGS
ncbi:MAG TPA: hypothetical protein VGC30_15070 [Dokdonella sp.]